MGMKEAADQVTDEQLAAAGMTREQWEGKAPFTAEQHERVWKIEQLIREGVEPEAAARQVNEAAGFRTMADQFAARDDCEGCDHPAPGGKVAAPRDMPAIVNLWAIPIRPALKVISETGEKPVGQLTMPEVMAWVFVFGYSALTGYALGMMAGNLLLVLVAGRRR